MLGKEQVRITEEDEGHMQNIYLSSDFFFSETLEKNKKRNVLTFKSDGEIFFCI